MGERKWNVQGGKGGWRFQAAYSESVVILVILGSVSVGDGDVFGCL